MRGLVRLSVLAALCAFGAAAAPRPATLDVDIAPMMMDREVRFGDVQAVCTGVGDTRTDPKWATYPIRVEFSDAKDEYVTDALVTLVNSKSGAALMVRCDGPWLLLQPPAGAYAVYAQLMDSQAKPRSARFSVPVRGQRRVVLQFPDA